jgi:hypothetical protein
MNPKSRSFLVKVISVGRGRPAASNVSVNKSKCPFDSRSAPTYTRAKDIMGCFAFRLSRALSVRVAPFSCSILPSHFYLCSRTPVFDP